MVTFSAVTVSTTNSRSSKREAFKTVINARKRKRVLTYCTCLFELHSRKVHRALVHHNRTLTKRKEKKNTLDSTTIVIIAIFFIFVYIN